MADLRRLASVDFQNLSELQDFQFFRSVKFGLSSVKGEPKKNKNNSIVQKVQHTENGGARPATIFSISRKIPKAAQARQKRLSCSFGHMIFSLKNLVQIGLVRTRVQNFCFVVSLFRLFRMF
jgi:hypothetical protein